MKTLPKSNGRWSELPTDILCSVFKRFSYADFQRAKLVCTNWYSCSKQKLPKQYSFPWLILFPEKTLFPEESCVLYNPEEDRVYKTNQDFSGTRFLANSGNWFLVLDSRANLYIIDIFSGKRINLPPLESIRGGRQSLERVGDRKFKQKCCWLNNEIESVENLKGVLWVDEKKEEYVVAWCFDVGFGTGYIGFCKNGEDHYSEIPIKGYDMVLVGYNLYVSRIHEYIRLVDLSGQEGFKDISGKQASKNVSIKSSEDIRHLRDMLSDNEIERKRQLAEIAWIVYKSLWHIVAERDIAVTASGEVLKVRSFLNKERHRFFKLSKESPNPELKVASLGDEALLLDLGITVPADPTLGIEPNSIYFTRDDRVSHKEHSCLDICVFNLGTKTLKRFPILSKLNLKDARWFLPQA